MALKQERMLKFQCLICMENSCCSEHIIKFDELPLKLREFLDSHDSENIKLIYSDEFENEE